MLQDFANNVLHNLFKPLLLFFYMGFTIPLLGVPFEFPHVIYQGLTMYLLIAIGWHGGEELASLNAAGLQQALGFMVIGFIVNFIIGCIAYGFLRAMTRLRKVDAATVAGYYGSDSAGTFVTCRGVLESSNPIIPYAAYMPVLLAVMEIPGCLVALFLVSLLRRHGMDGKGNMPGESDYDPNSLPEGATIGGHGNGGGHDHRHRRWPKPRPTAQKPMAMGMASTSSSTGNCCTRCFSIPACTCCSAGSPSGTSAGCRAKRSSRTTTSCSLRCFKVPCACSCLKWA